jgi:SRSO17 transposase
VLVIDEHGDRKRGHKTAHIGKQYLANLGKLDTGVVSVTSMSTTRLTLNPTPQPITLKKANKTRSSVPN